MKGIILKMAVQLSANKPEINF